MSMVVQCATTSVQNNHNTPARELENHPAFYSILTKNNAEKILKGSTPMSYILWIELREEGEEVTQHNFLSYMDTSLTVEHRTFSHHNGWKNCDPHREELLINLIPRMMHCNPSDCKMHINPNQYPQKNW